MSVENPRKALAQIYRAAVGAVEPAARVASVLEPTRQGARLIVRGRGVELERDRLRIIAAGKAAAAMTAGAIAALGGRRIPGVVAAPRGGPRLPKSLARFAAEHPVPGRQSLAAGRAVWSLAGGLDRDDTVLVLLSGGASSMLVLPAAGVTLADKIATTTALLRAGASIAETNVVRKHLSQLKGGGLARRAEPARVVVLVLSDVIGDSPAVIGSGPAAPDSTVFADACRVLERFDLLARVPHRVRERLERGRAGEIDETAKPGEIRARHVIVGNVRTALAAAAGEARRLGFAPRIWTERLRGEARRAAARVAREIGEGARTRRICLLAGGETTVRVTGDGRGGRNQELALALAMKIAGRSDVTALAAGTDGIDGPTDAAGAFVDGETTARARRCKLELREFLQRNDSYGFFSRMGDLFRPGATGTNVMDLTIVLIEPGARG